MQSIVPLLVSMTVILAGCASTVPLPSPHDARMPVAVQWHAPLPHAGQVGLLPQWWSQFEDPLLPRLIEDSQRASPTLAQAAATIAEARAVRTSAFASLLPMVDVVAAGGRSRSNTQTAPVVAFGSAGVQASWELDLFGASRAGARAASAQLESSLAGWHDARVAVAAEVATNYVELRGCEAQLRQADLDAASREETSRLTGLAASAGFQSPATADLARASAAQGRMAAVRQKTQCDLLLKALVALTARDELQLRSELEERAALLPQPAQFGISAIPAEVLAQRPDIRAAAWDVVAASAASARATAMRLPRITLTGSVSRSSQKSEGVSTEGTAWSIGPVTVTLPLFDGGMRRANSSAARVRYDAAVSVYQARLRKAIQEVESALVALDSTALRSADARLAVDGFERSYRATATSFQAGLVSLFELEDARRSMTGAQRERIELDRERLIAWIALYRAAGGGWSSAEQESRSAQ